MYWYFNKILDRNATIKITINKMIEIITMLLKWYKNDTLFEKAIKIIGDNKDEIKTARKVLIIPIFSFKYFLYVK